MCSYLEFLPFYINSFVVWNICLVPFQTLLGYKLLIELRLYLEGYRLLYVSLSNPAGIHINCGDVPLVSNLCLSQLQLSLLQVKVTNWEAYPNKMCMYGEIVWTFFLKVTCFWTWWIIFKCLQRLSRLTHSHGAPTLRIYFISWCKSTCSCILELWRLHGSSSESTMRNLFVGEDN